MTRNWIRWCCVPLAFAGLFMSIESAVAVASPQRASGSIDADALKVPITSVVCSTTRNCVAIGTQPYGSTVGSIGVTTSDGGSTWASTPILRGVKYLQALACPATRTCVAVGSNPLGNGDRGAVLRTLNGGRTWVLAPALPKGVGRLVDVSCPTKTFCMAVGVTSSITRAVGVISNDAGRSWRTVRLPKGEEDLSLVTCTTRRYCIAEGEMEATIGDPQSGNRLSIITTTNRGSAWKQSSFSTSNAAPIGIPTFSGLTCATPTHCLIVGDAAPGDGSPSGMIASSTDRGASWTFHAVPPGTTFLNAISCGSSTQCAVAGGGIEARGGIDRDILTTTDAGKSWISRVVPAAAVDLDGVSCPSATSCMAVGFGLSSTDPSPEPAAVVVSGDGGATWSTAP